MKILLSLCLCVWPVLAAKIPPKVISLGEIRIEGDVERPTVSFVIPRAQIKPADEKKWLQKITAPIKNGIFIMQ